MVHILEKQAKNIISKLIYWRNLPGKLELAEMELSRLKEELEDSRRQIKDFMAVEDEYIKFKKEVKRLQRQSAPPSIEDSNYWNNKWGKSNIYYAAPKRKLITSYLNYEPLKEIKDIADDIIEKNTLTGEKVDQVPLYVMKWLESGFKSKKFKYVSDNKETWQTPLETLNRKKGDCDDWGILEYNLIREILKMFGLWEKNKHRLKAVDGHVHESNKYANYAGRHFYLLWLADDCEFYTVESTYYRPRAILNYKVKPHKKNSQYSIINYTFNEQYCWSQKSAIIEVRDYGKKSKVSKK